MGHGTIATAPWPKVRSNKTYKEAWPELDESVDPIQSAADYYLLFGIVNNSFVKFEELRLPSQSEVLDAAIKLGYSFNDLVVRAARIKRIVDSDPRKDLTELSDAAESMMSNLVEKLDPVFKAYVYMACGGELRHHSAIGGNTLSVTRSKAWSAYRKIVDEHGFEEVLPTTALYFRDFNSNSYGSERWAIAAELLLQRELGELGPTEYLNKMLFVDRVFTLEHNGGCFLNKIEWANNRSNLESPFCYGVNYMKQIVLDAHCANPPMIDRLYKTASADVRDLVRNYFQSAHDHGINILIDSYKSIISTSVLDDKELVMLLEESTNTSSNQPTTFKLSSYCKNTLNHTIELFKNGEKIHAEDMENIPYYTSLYGNQYAGPVTITFEPTIVHEGNPVPLYKTYYLDSIDEFSDKKLYWKHLSKTHYKGAGVAGGKLSVYFGDYCLKINYNKVPATIYCWYPSLMLFSLKKHFEGDN